jgi:hypothetical protein
MQIEILEGEELEHMKQEFLALCQKFHASWDVEPIRKYYIEHYLTK